MTRGAFYVKTPLGIPGETTSEEVYERSVCLAGSGDSGDATTADGASFDDGAGRTAGFDASDDEDA